MKQIIILIVFVALAAAQSKNNTCVYNQEVFLKARGICAGTCTENHSTCGGGTCKGLECVCEPRFKLTKAKTLCVPDCSTVENCNVAGGSCDAPGICNCAAKGTYFENGKCLAKTQCEGDCHGKICDASGCKCDEKYYEAVNGKCKRKCIGLCDAAKGLECVEPGVCACMDKTLNINAEGKCVKINRASQKVKNNNLPPKKISEE